MATTVEVKKIPTPGFKKTDFRYSSTLLYEVRGVPLHFYTNNAQKIAGQFILTEGILTKGRISGSNRPFCVVNNEKAANEALYYLAMENAEKKIRELRIPKIKDLTQKTQ